MPTHSRHRLTPLCSTVTCSSRSTPAAMRTAPASSSRTELLFIPRSPHRDGRHAVLCLAAALLTHGHIAAGALRQRLPVQRGAPGGNERAVHIPDAGTGNAGGHLVILGQGLFHGVVVRHNGTGRIL